MTQNEWKIIWINTLIAGGFSERMARATFQAMYRDDPDLAKNPEQDAVAMLGIFKSENAHEKDGSTIIEHRDTG